MAFFRRKLVNTQRWRRSVRPKKASASASGLFPVGSTHAWPQCTTPASVGVGVGVGVGVSACCLFVCCRWILPLPLPSAAPLRPVNGDKDILRQQDGCTARTPPSAVLVGFEAVTSVRLGVQVAIGWTRSEATRVSAQTVAVIIPTNEQQQTTTRLLQHPLPRSQRSALSAVSSWFVMDFRPHPPASIRRSLSSSPTSVCEWGGVEGDPPCGRRARTLDSLAQVVSPPPLVASHAPLFNHAQVRLLQKERGLPK